MEKAIKTDYSSFAEFEISEFEISRVDCIRVMINIFVDVYILPSDMNAIGFKLCIYMKWSNIYRF